MRLNRQRQGGGEVSSGQVRRDLSNPLVRMFATRLLKWRREQGKALKEVAGDLGVSISIVSEWEHGHRFPSIDHLQAVTRYTGISASQFLCQEEERCASVPAKGRTCG